MSEEIAIVKVTDLQVFVSEIRKLKEVVSELRTKNNLKSYTVQATSELLGVSYNTVRKLIKDGELTANYINGNEKKGKCIIPAWSIENYLNSKR